MVWMMFGVIGIPIKKMLNLNSTHFGLLMSMPVLTGRWCACRGHLTDKLRRPHRDGHPDGRHRARHLDDGLRHRILALPDHRPLRGSGGRLLLGGHPYVARWFPKNRQGTAMGIYGAGNPGAPSTSLLRRSFCGLWLAMVPRCTPPSCWARWCCSAVQLQRPCPSGAQQRQVHRPAQGAQGPRCSSTASTTASCSVAMWRCRCGWCSTTWESLVWTSACRLAGLAACFSLPGGVLRHRRHAV